MVEDISAEGICPTVESDEVVSPVWDDDRDEYVCPECGVGFGADSEEAQRNAQNHFISA